MFGTREEFCYFQCSDCGCLQITEIPSDIARHYPDRYYSLARNHEPPPATWRAFLQKQRYRAMLFGKGQLLGALLARIVTIRNLRLDYVLPMAKVLQLARVRDYSARFLDIGCGAWSDWLASLRAMGFRQLMGADPFVSGDVAKDGITILKRNIAEVTGSFDLITFHHSLEHIADQQATLAAARALLAPGGVVLVRIPTVSSFAWEHYQTNWVEMDAPRHFYLHSRNSIRLLGDSVGLNLYTTVCDSRMLEFYGSEQYARGIPLSAEESYWSNKKSRLFSEKELEHFRQKAREVNESQRGGRACFFFAAA